MHLSSLTLTLAHVEPAVPVTRTVTWPTTELAILTAAIRMLTGEPDGGGWVITEMQARA